MRLLRALVVAPIILCFFSRSIGQETKPPVTTDAAQVSTPENRPYGFWRNIFYDLRKMFFKNKHANAVTAQEITDNWNETVSKISVQVTALSNQIKAISGDFADVMKLGNSSKDMIGKVLTVVATGVGSVSDVLNIMNSILRVGNEVFQGFSRITDLLYYGFQRNNYNYQEMITYTPKEVIHKVIEIYNDILALLEKIREIVVAFSDQVKIMLLQLAVNVENRTLPVRLAVAGISRQINKSFQRLIETLDHMLHAVRSMLAGLTNTATQIVKSTADMTTKEIKTILHSLDNIKESIIGIFKPKSHPQVTTSGGVTDGARMTTPEHAAATTTTSP